MVKRRPHASASQSRITKASLVLLCYYRLCDAWNSGTVAIRSQNTAPNLFLYQVPPSVTPPGGLLGAAVCKNEWPLFSMSLIAHSAET